MNKSKKMDSCRELFKTMEILPLYSQHIFSLLMYVVNNKHLFTKKLGSQNNAENAFQCSKTVSEYNTDMTQWSHKKWAPVFLVAITAHRTPILTSGIAISWINM